VYIERVGCTSDLNLTVLMPWYHCWKQLLQIRVESRSFLRLKYLKWSSSTGRNSPHPFLSQKEHVTKVDIALCVCEEEEEK